MVKDSDTFRENASNCAELAAATENEPTKNRYKRMEAAWLALAKEQDWLDGHSAPTKKERGSELAEGTVDRLSDEDTSGCDAENRKRDLIDGPAEFRDDRIDND